MSRRIQRWMTDRYLRLGERLGRWTTPAWLAGVVVLLIAVTSMMGFVLLVLAPDSPGAFDVGIAEWLAPRRTASLTRAVQVVTRVGDTISLVILGAVVGLAWRWRRGDWAGLAVLIGPTSARPACIPRSSRSSDASDRPRNWRCSRCRTCRSRPGTRWAARPSM